MGREDIDERAAPRNEPRHRYRHAGVETLAKFLRPQASGESITDLDEIARRTQNEEAAELMEEMVDRSTHRWLDEKWAQFKGQFPYYIALFMIVLCVCVVLYFTTKRP